MFEDQNAIILFMDGIDDLMMMIHGITTCGDGTFPVESSGEGQVLHRDIFPFTERSHSSQDDRTTTTSSPFQTIFMRLTITSSSNAPPVAAEDGTYLRVNMTRQMDLLLSLRYFIWSSSLQSPINLIAI